MLLSFTVVGSCNGGGQRIVPPGSGQPTTTENSLPKIIKDPGTSQFASVNCGLQDKAGNIWFGTPGQGVYRYNGKSFANFTIKDGLCNDTVVAIVEDKLGAIWIATQRGLCQFDGKNFTNVPLTLPDNSNLYPTTGSDNNNSQKGIRNLLVDRMGKIWIATSADGVYYYNGKTFIHFLHNDGVANASNLRLNAVVSMMEDKGGNIWFTTWFEGLCRYDGKSITNFKPNGEVWFAGLFQDKSGNIWVGTRSHGVYRYNGKTFVDYFADKDVFNKCCIMAITQDKQGNIWFGSEPDDMAKRADIGGAWRYNPSAEGATFTNFTTKDGLVQNNVFCILEDNLGYLWFGTRNLGLCRYDGKSFTSFSE